MLDYVVFKYELSIFECNCTGFRNSSLKKKCMSTFYFFTFEISPMRKMKFDVKSSYRGPLNLYK